MALRWWPLFVLTILPFPQVFILSHVDYSDIQAHDHLGELGTYVRPCGHLSIFIILCSGSCLWFSAQASWQSLVKESVFVSQTADTCPVIALLILSLFPPLIFSIPHHLRELTCYKIESLITSATWLVSQCVWVSVYLFVLRVLGETVHVCNVQVCFSCSTSQKVIIPQLVYI